MGFFDFFVGRWFDDIIMFGKFGDGGEKVDEEIDFFLGS